MYYHVDGEIEDFRCPLDEVEENTLKFPFLLKNTDILHFMTKKGEDGSKVNGSSAVSSVKMYCLFTHLNSRIIPVYFLLEYFE